MFSNASVHPENRNRALDGLRGVAALLIVVSHMVWLSHPSSAGLVRHGYLAVDLFFILSGLVIAANYAHRIASPADLRAFLCLRFFRLYPLHIVMVAALVLLELGRASGERFAGIHSPAALVATILLVQGLHVVPASGWNPPSWSISCEGATYLLFAAAAWGGLLRRRACLVAGFALAVMLYAVLALGLHTLDVRFDWGILRCVAGFTLGMLLALLPDPRHQPTALAAAGQVAAVTMALAAMEFADGGWTVLAIPPFALSIALLRRDRGPVARLLLSRPAQFLGRISYSLYMVHWFVLLWPIAILNAVFPWEYDPAAGIAFIATNRWLGDVLVVVLLAAVLAIATATYNLIEEPARIFGRRLVASSGARGAAPLLARQRQQPL